MGSKILLVVSILTSLAPLILMSLSLLKMKKISTLDAQFKNQLVSFPS